jgi:hypothetical protein
MTARSEYLTRFRGNVGSVGSGILVSDTASLLRFFLGARQWQQVLKPNISFSARAWMQAGQ